MIKSKRRVVITGIGVISPNGIGKADFWTALKEGRSGVKEISLFDTKELPTNVAGEVSNFDAKDFVPKNMLHTRGRSSHFALATTLLALEDAGIPLASFGKRRSAVLLGTTFPAMDQFQDQIRALSSRGHYLSRDPFHLYTAASPNIMSMDIAEVFGFHGTRMTIANACSSGATAMKHAFRSIQRGSHDVALAGGVDACLDYFTYAGFIAAGFQVVSSFPPTKVSRPYDQYRAGAVCSEGAALVVIEELDFALTRGATIYGEILGAGESFQIPNHGEFAIRAGLAESMRLALEDAALATTEVDYICSHGPSLVKVDEMETLAIKDVFGSRAYAVPISSIKSMIGNPMAASAPMQVVACLLALNHSVVPPTVNLDFPDPKCDLDYVPNLARRNSVQNCLVDSHGMDNIDLSVVLTRRPC